MIESERLILRGWREDDLEPFAVMCADPQVMATLGPLMSREETRALIARVETLRAEHGFTFWAMERRADGAFLGWCGVKPGAANTPIEGQIEIGWRIAADHWGQGYAREAAAATLAWVWANLDAPLVAAITTPGNVRSWGLMERLGMVRAPEDDFDHPNLPDDSPLKAHVTYRIRRPG
ncbi:GNAT family N-acetyltransferase [Sphingomonas sp.]|uniref:GNAT family N-acetyltransferase n=1 Tax=Sphingomonas sp. TaxID=28214 RepID=UPI001B087BC6|nr:GNAT family N-acetyltransferase [Sphingomonas sp.]MBO9713764.1 GNAT family N-acetyltransferase [Sphingomonas sp.]